MYSSKRKSIIDKPQLSNLLCLTARHFPSYIKKNKNHSSEHK